MENSVMPVYEVNKGEGGADSNFMWIFFLFFLLAAGGGAGGGLFGGRAAEANTISNDFMYSNLNNTLGRIADQNSVGFSSVSSGINGLEKDIYQAGYQSLSNFKDLTAQMAQCCCETNRNIDATRYENLRNTADIIQANNANTQTILDKMCQNEIQALRDRLSIVENANSNLLQSKTIVEQLRPYPQPAYIVCSPYGVDSNGNGNNSLVKTY